MTQRTVTEAEVIAALEKLGHSAYQLTITANIMNKLFPGLPESGELVLVWDNGQKSHGEWFPFIEIDCGVIMVTDHDGDKESWDNYRRQTPEERGEV